MDVLEIADERELGDFSGFGEAEERLGDLCRSRELTGRAVCRDFNDSIICVYRREMLESIKRKNANADITEIAFTLKKDRSLQSRYKHQQVTPSLESYFLAFAAFDLEAQHIKFSRGKLVVNEAVRSTMQRIRAQLTGEGCAAPTPQELECVFLATYSRDWHDAVGKTPQELARVAAKLRKEIAYITKTACTFSVDDIKAIIDNWEVPWLILHTLIPYEWTY